MRRSLCWPHHRVNPIIRRSETRAVGWVHGSCSGVGRLVFALLVGRALPVGRDFFPVHWLAFMPGFAHHFIGEAPLRSRLKFDVIVISSASWLRGASRAMWLPEVPPQGRDARPRLGEEEVAALQKVHVPARWIGFVIDQSPQFRADFRLQFGSWWLRVPMASSRA